MMGAATAARPRPTALPEPARSASLVHRFFSLTQIAAGLVLLALIVLLLSATAPSILGFESFVVLSGSMEPAIHVGDIAVVQPAKAVELKVGDVVTYRTPQQPDVVVTHRLIAASTDDQGRLSFQTKGDANNVPDQVAVDQGAVLGKVAYAIPKAGYLVNFSRSSEGKLSLIAVPGILLLADYGRERLSRRKRGVSAPGAMAAADLERAQALLERGRQALESGYSELAAKAADGVLAIDSRNEDAWLLKAQATPDATSRRALLQAALAVNPSAHRIVDALRSL